MFPSACGSQETVGGPRSLPEPVLIAATPTDAQDFNLIKARLQAQQAQGSHGCAAEHLGSQAVDGHWADIDYNDRSQGLWRPIEHLDRLGEMAVAYKSRESRLFRDQRLLSGIVRGLRYWFDRRPRSDSWWYNTIGQQKSLSRVLVLLDDELPEDLRRAGIGLLLDPKHPEVRYTTGQNLVWYATEQLVRGTLTRSAADLTAASEALQREIRITTEEGIQPDYSFHQHGPQLANGSYGHGFIADNADNAALLQGTRFAFAPEKLALLADYLLEGTRYMIRGRLLDYSTGGRGVTHMNAGEGALALRAACDQLAAMVPDRAADLIALKHHIEGTGTPYSVVGNRHFWRSDFMTHQRPRFYISAKMVSRRTIGSEILNGENLQGFWLPYGLTWIIQRGDEYRDIFPVLDWARLPGVTAPHVVQGTGKWYTQPHAFVGGASDGVYGAAAMVFEQLATRGAKAWFFFDDEVVALGTGITSTRPEPVNTTLDQTLLKGPVLADGRRIRLGASTLGPTSWVLHGGVGYVFPDWTRAAIKIGPQVGSWKAINDRYSDTAVSKDVMTLWIDHGVSPGNAGYAYVVVPGMDEQRIDAYARRLPVRVVANTSSLQAVVHDWLGVAGLVFQSPGTAEIRPGLSIQVDRPCIVVLARQGDQLRVAVANPVGEAAMVQVTVMTSDTQMRLAFDLPGGDLGGSTRILAAPVRW